MPVVVGSKVRVRVSGRRLAGYVTATFTEQSDRRLLPVDGVTGSAPVFDEELLSVCRWTAEHYVAPLSTILKRTSPPNAPKAPRGTVATQRRASAEPDTGSDTYLVSASPHIRPLVSLVDAHNAQSTLHIVAPTAFEVDTIATALRDIHDTRVVTATSSMPAKDVTRAWQRAAHDPTTILVGTRETVLWKLAGGGRWIVVEEGRRVMKSPATPTIHVREIVIRRSRGDRTTTFVGPLPTLEVISAGVKVHEPPGRRWPVVEVVDRTEEPPGSPLITGTARTAINGAVRDGKRVFVLVTARGYAPAFRCRSCAQLRRCKVCGTAASTDGACRRCGETLGPCRDCGGSQFAPLGAGVGRLVDEIASFVGAGNVGDAGARRKVVVGSERDLVDLGPVGLGVVVDIDGIAGAPHYRASEDALRLCIRVAHHVERGDRNRLIVQTAAPTQPLVRALVAGDASQFLSDEMAVRTAAGFPPVGSLIAIEVGTESTQDADTILRSAIAGDAVLRGPAPMRDRSRWLVQGRDLDRTRIALRTAVGELRGLGAKVRVDVDPVDL